jgi:hypothetical protein
MTQLASVVEIPSTQKSGVIRIMPYVDPARSNMGLEKYDQVVFDGVKQTESMTCLQQNGVLRFINGLNEFAPEIKLIKDAAERQARINEIRKDIVLIEQAMAANVLDIEDKDFWAKVQICKPDNKLFWGTIDLTCSNDSVVLDPEKDIRDLIKVRAIEAGGFAMVAKSYEDARSRSTPPKFYLDRIVDTIGLKMEPKKLRNKALGELQKLYDNSSDKLFYVIKSLDTNCIQYKYNTPKDILYDACDKHITGLGSERNVKRAAELFITTSKLTLTELKVKAIYRDATYLKFIELRGDGMFYHFKSGSMLGKNPSECIEFIKNPANSKVLEDLQIAVEEYWKM